MKLYTLFSELLDYPGASLRGVLRECIAECRRMNPEAAEHLLTFQRRCRWLGPGRLEEVYAATFDLRAECSLYAGYHLFGDHWGRSVFMSELQTRYRAWGFSPGQEVPDHIPVLLRFLSVQGDPVEEAVLIEDCLIPALEKIRAELEGVKNPYQALVEGMVVWLKGISPEGVREEAAQAEEVSR